MNFGDAIDLLKRGKKVARVGWNGKGMYLFLVSGQTVQDAINGAYGAEQRPVRNAIYMSTADGSLVPWVASQSDILDEDWVEAEL